MLQIPLMAPRHCPARSDIRVDIVRSCRRLQAKGKDLGTMRTFIAVLLGMMPAVLAATASEAAGAAGTAIVVLDGSGSMGGPLEGQDVVKFDMASHALLQLLTKAQPQSRAGLVTFGNRRKGDCSDVDVAIPAATGNLDQFTAVFGKIGPTGKGPLVQGVREAAKALPTDAPGTLIVIHDDIDNCRQDVCAAATDIARMIPKVTVHVISISLDKTTPEKMSCLATTTGGRVFEARDAASVESSLGEALALANVTGPGDPKLIEPPAAAIAPGPSSGPPSLHLSAGLAASGPALAAAVQWRVLTAGIAGQVVKEANVPVFSSELPAGSYVVEARYGNAHASQTIEVAPQGQTQARLSFEAANLKVTTGLADATLTVSALGDKTSPPKPVYVGHGAQAELVVPAGTYRIAARGGLAAKQQDITLAVGDVTPVDFSLGTGKLELSSQNKEGGEALDGTIFVLLVDDPDAPQGRRELARSIAPHPNFVLPAGTYYVSAKLGAAETRERIAIGTGDIVKRVITLNGAWTQLTANFDQSLASKPLAVGFSVVKKTKDATEIAHLNGLSGGSTDIFLPQGSYRIAATIGRLNVSGAADAEIVTGAKSAVAISVAVSELTLQPAAETSSPVGWDVRDSDGRVVQRSAASRSQKTLLMAPGHYLVRVEAGDTHFDKPVDLKPGERRTVQLSAN